MGPRIGEYVEFEEIAEYTEKFFFCIQALFAVMAMATSAIELPDTIQGYGNNLAYYHQQEERNPAFNLDNRDLSHQVDYEYSVPSYNVDYSVPSYYDGSQPKLSDGLSSWWSTKPLDAPSPPTIVFSRPHYSNEIKGDTFSQRVMEQGHKILKRSPKPPFDPKSKKTIAKGLIKTSLAFPAKGLIKAPLALPLKYKKWKATTGPLFFGACNLSAKIGGKKVGKLTFGIGKLGGAAVKKFCPLVIPLG